MVESIQSTSAPSPVTADYNNSDFSKESTMNQLEMGSAFQSLLSSANSVHEQAQENADQEGNSYSVVRSF